MEPLVFFSVILRRKEHSCVNLLTYAIPTHTNTHTVLTAEVITPTEYSSCLDRYVEKESRGGVQPNTGQHAVHTPFSVPRRRRSRWGFFAQCVTSWMSLCALILHSRHLVHRAWVQSCNHQHRKGQIRSNSLSLHAKNLVLARANHILGINHSPYCHICIICSFLSLQKRSPGT